MSEIVESAVVYKITYPNNKIYVGQDHTDTITYFGSPNSALIESDFSSEEKDDFSIRKEILWRKANVSRAEVTAVENQLIHDLNANNPKIGYNRMPKYRGEIDD